MFYRPDSHDVLDIILPAAMNFERHAPFGIYASSVAVRTPVKPLGEAKEDWRIAFEIGCLIDKPENFFDGDPEKALDWLLQKWNRRLDKAVADLPALTQFDAPKKAFRKYETGAMRKDGKPGFNTPSGKCEFFSERAAKFGYPGIPAYVPMMPLTKEFDLRFLNGARKPTSRTRRRVPTNRISSKSKIVSRFPSIPMMRKSAASLKATPWKSARPSAVPSKRAPWSPSSFRPVSLTDSTDGSASKTRSSLFAAVTGIR